MKFGHLKTSILLFSALALVACDGSSGGGGSGGSGCPEGFHDGGDGKCVEEGICSPEYLLDENGDCDSPTNIPAAPELEVPERVTGGKSYEARVRNPVGSSSYAWTVVGATVEVATGSSVTFTAGSSGTVTFSCIETNQAGVSSKAGKATSTIVPMPATPAIIAPVTIAVGDEDTAKVDPQPDVTFTWSIENGEFKGSSSNVLAVKFVATSGRLVKLTCHATNTLGDGVEGSRKVTVFPTSYPTVLGKVATQVQAGGSHACALPGDGRVMCWGGNSSGQLGNGTTTGSSRPVEVDGLDGIVAIAAGHAHTCALTTAGGVQCWGDNSDGQVGGGARSSSTPVEVSELDGVAAIAAGDYHTCALTSAGTVKCWGNNNNGQLGVNRSTTSSTVPMEVSDLDGIVAIATGGFHTCALTGGGAVRCWGNNDDGQLGGAGSVGPSEKVSGLESVAAIEAGYAHTCALTTAGAVKCWGRNADGQLGDGSTGDSPVPVEVQELASGVDAIVAGADHSCALTSTGAVWCWGSNSSGQLGRGSVTSSPIPLEVIDLDGDIAAIGAGSDGSCALTSAGGVLCWGLNESGQLGNGSTNNSATPVAVSGFASRIEQIATGYDHTCARASTGAVWCWGENSSGQLGNGTTDDSSTPVEVSLPNGVAGFVDLAVGAYHTCGRTGAGAVWCWGSNDYGRLGNGTTTNSPTPVEVSLPSGVAGFVEVEAGENHTCARTNAGAVWCWGFNAVGQLGNNAKSDSSKPVQASMPSGVSGFADIEAGSNHTCARTNSGAIWCWGDNSYGQLGDSSTTAASTPVAVSLPSGVAGFTEIAAGEVHTCARTNAGAVWCWGRNYHGQLGNDSWTNSSTPVAVGLPSGVASFSEIAAGSAHTCARTNAGAVWCWGFNAVGQLGNNSTTNSSTPVAVSLPSGVASLAEIAAGFSHTCGRTSAGAVWCWGSNGDGQLGNEFQISSSKPMQASLPIGVAGFAKIVAGSGHICGRTSAGAVWCWGVNGNGQLGNGTTTRSPTPVAVSRPSGAEGFVEIAAGSNHTCGLTSAGAAWCWGSNGDGQLGNNSYIDSSTPVQVSLPIGVLGFAEIAAGSYHTCGRTSAGAVWCWGFNGNGQLGDNSWTDSSIPVVVSLPGGVGGFAEITASYRHTCGRTAAGAVWCWGRNFDGQLGNGTKDDSSTPAQASLPSGVAGFAEIAAGSHHTCGRTSAGAVWCWGFNGYGQLGNGSTDHSWTAVPVSLPDGVSGFARIATGLSHTCGRTSAGAVWCWGDNDYGQLGDNSKTDSSTPVAVSLPSGVAGFAEVATGSSHTCGLTSAGAVWCWGLNEFGQLGFPYAWPEPVAVQTGQSIAFSPPVAGVPGAEIPLEDFALASSGLEVTFDTWTPDVCSVSGTALKIDGGARSGDVCGVIARQPGSGSVPGTGNSFAPAPDQLRLLSVTKP